MDGVEGAKINDISTTEAVKAITMNTTSLIFLYICGKIKTHHDEKLEFCRVLPRSNIFLAENCCIADKDTNIKNGVSFKISPKIKNRPYSSGIIKKFGGLSNPVSQGEINLKNRPLGEKININPTAIVICGKAIKGDINILI